MGSVELLLDTNVLINVWRGSPDLEEVTGKFVCGVETIACVEFLQGVNKRQKTKEKGR